MQRFIKKILVGILLSTAISTYVFAENKYNSVEEFIADQKVIRVLMDNAAGFGNQSATINLMNRLRQMNFHGTFEFIYPDEESVKVTTLFNLPNDLPDVYYYQDASKQKITFIRESAYVNRLINHQLAEITLAITGAHDWQDEPACYKVPACKPYGDNFANYTNANVFLELQPWFDDPERVDSLAIKNGDAYKVIQPPGKYLIFPVTNFADAKNYLTNDPSGKELLNKIPALQTLIDGIEANNFNLLSIYGRTLTKSDNVPEHDQYYFPNNIMQAITGARYAQLYGTAEMHKPLIISIFYDYSKEAAEIMTLLQSNNWGDYEKLGANNMRSALTSLGLKQPNVFSTISITDVDASKKIKLLQPGQILLLSMGPLPKVVFDGLYSHTRTNIWPQIREGEGSLSILLMRGNPHLRCGINSHNDERRSSTWEPGFGLVKDAVLKTRLESFYGKNGFCAKDIWVTNPTIYQDIGGFIIEGNDPQSAFSQYFRDLLDDSTKVENDRIHRGLEEALKVVNKAK